MPKIVFEYFVFIWLSVFNYVQMRYVQYVHLNTISKVVSELYSIKNYTLKFEIFTQENSQFMVLWIMLNFAKKKGGVS